MTVGFIMLLGVGVAGVVTGHLNLAAYFFGGSAFFPVCPALWTLMDLRAGRRYARQFQKETDAMAQRLLDDINKHL